MKDLVFGDVISLLWDGYRLAREGWNGVASGRSMWIELQVPDSHSKMTRPYIFMSTDGDRIPWVASHSDMLARDWFVVE